MIADMRIIVDEVITGFGRTGHWFGTGAYGLKPDIVSLAKGVTSAYFPVSATGANDGRGIAMTASAEMVRSSDGKRLMFAGASQIKDSETKGVRMAPYAEWFTNDDFLVE